MFCTYINTSQRQILDIEHMLILIVGDTNRIHRYRFIIYSGADSTDKQEGLYYLAYSE